MTWLAGTFEWLILGIVGILYLLVGGWLFVKQVRLPDHRKDDPTYLLLFALTTAVAIAAVVTAGVLGVRE